MVSIVAWPVVAADYAQNHSRTVVHSAEWKLPQSAPSVGPLVKPKKKSSAKHKAKIVRKNPKKAKPSSTTPKSETVRNAPLTKQAALHLALIRGLISALDQANFTGNYSVLYDLASPSLKTKIDAEKLKNNFKPLRDLKLDLTPALYLPPTYQAAEGEIASVQALRLTGTFPTEPTHIKFDLTYKAVEGFWRVNDFRIDLVSPPE